MTEKQKIFCDEYLIDLNASRAYKAAYPNVKTDHAARSCGYKLLTNADILSYISERQKDRQQRTEIIQDMVVKELRDIAIAKASDDSDSTLKYSNKIKALELLGRHLGMFKDRVEISTQKDDMAKMDDILRQMGMIDEQSDPVSEV